MTKGYITIQPDMIGEIIKDGRDGNLNDGFIDRFLFCYPEPTPSKWTDKDVSDEVIDGYCDVIFKLYYELMEDNPREITLSVEAKEAFTTWYDVTEGETSAATFPETLKGVWRKLKGLQPRILLIIHLLKWASTPGTVNANVIDEDTVAYTNYVMEYFKKHAKKVFQYTQSNFRDMNVIKLMDFVRRKGEKHDKGFSIRVNALNQGKVFGRNTDIRLIEETIERIEGQVLGEIQYFTYKSNAFRQFVLYSKAF